MTEQLNPLFDVLDTATHIFRGRLEAVKNNGGLTEEQYIRYLSMQYHLTHGVQWFFLTMLANPCFEGRRKFRNFLYNFALEEEPHAGMALRDLEAMGQNLLPKPLDVALWWSYFRGNVQERPFLRIGAAFILENLGTGIKDIGHDLLDGSSASSFLNERNTRFLIVHMHEELPHGDQIIAALSEIKLTDQERADLVTGARQGAIMYLRMADWALGVDPLQTAFAAEQEVLPTGSLSSASS